jgi:hypothetical protein
MLAWVTGRIDDSLRQKLEFVLEENRVYRALLERHSPHWRLQDSERKALAEKGRPLGKLLAEVITMVQPETLLKWHRRLVAKKWDFSARRAKTVGRPPVDAAVEKLVVQLAKDNAGWGYDRIVGALANLGHQVSDQTVPSPTPSVLVDFCNSITAKRHSAPAATYLCRTDRPTVGSAACEIAPRSVAGLPCPVVRGPRLVRGSIGDYFPAPTSSRARRSNPSTARFF